MKSPNMTAITISTGKGGFMQKILAAEAGKAGIELPVSIDDALVNDLTPSPFLASMGVTLEARIQNLLSLVRGNLHGLSGDENHDEQYYIPLIIATGPFIKEDFLSVLATVHHGDGNKSEIMLKAVAKDENEL
jgi:hypothetical protein